MDLCTCAEEIVLCLNKTAKFDKIIETSPVFESKRFQLVSLRQHFESCQTQGKFDLLKAANICFKFVEDVQVCTAISVDDDSSIILSLLVETWGPTRFAGPPFESLFLTVHKFYTRQIIDPSPVPFCHIALHQPPTGKELESILCKVGLPAVLKPTSGSGSVLVTKITSVHDFERAIACARSSVSSLVSDLMPIISLHMDTAKYPLALTEGMVLERYVDGDIFDLDGYVFNHKFYPWALYDMITWDCNLRVNRMLIIPSVQPADMKCKLWDMFQQVACRLIQHGFNNQFMNIQLFLCKNGDIKLLEINGRMSVVCAPLCRQSLNGGDTIEAAVNVKQGKNPARPTPTGVHSAYVSLRSLISGKADEIIDFNAVQNMDHVTLSVSAADFIETVGDCGKSCGHAYLFANSREEIFQKHNELYQKLFKKHPIGYDVNMNH